MATILTVHGTNATGPQHGQRWWQLGSAFEAHLRELVASTVGELKYEPFIWSGANSEVSRRQAARELLRRIHELEEQQVPYTVIGHSHGGSVISHALLRSAAQRSELSSLRNWITVGTPFISMRRSALLFPRLGLIAKSAFVAALSFAILYSLAVIVEMEDALGIIGGAAYYVSAITILTLCVPVLVVYALLAYLSSRQLYMYQRRTVARSMREFPNRWVALWHKNDEALQGLRSLNTFEFSIFGRDFGAPLWALVSIFFLPGVLVYLISTQAALAALCAEPNRLGLTCYSTDHTFGRIDTIVFTLKNWLGLETSNDVSVLSLVVVPTILFVISICVTYVILRIGRSVSAVVSGFLNRITWREVRKLSIGNDALGENGLSVNEYPEWAGRGFAPLPDELGQEISSLSDREASKSIAKFRNAIGQLAFADSKSDKTAIVEQYLGWNELIHTSYFDVARFRKLIAYAVSKGEGFSASAQFKADPEFALVAQWYEQIKPVDNEPA